MWPPNVCGTCPAPSLRSEASGLQGGPAWPADGEGECSGALLGERARGRGVAERAPVSLAPNFSLLFPYGVCSSGSGGHGRKV